MKDCSGDGGKHTLFGKVKHVHLSSVAFVKRKFNVIIECKKNSVLRQ